MRSLSAPAASLLGVPALVGAALLLLPARDAVGFSKLGNGPTLGLSQRDFRVFNNFADPEANDNTTADPQFPGWDGAEAAIWKACVEWNSVTHGNGGGDPLQSNVGDGGANFDAYWAGAAADVGSPDHNIHSAVGNCQSGVLAYCEIPTGNGWRIRYCDNAWVWHDGPGDNPSGFDLQGVAAHEYGHALGLGHSASGSATMYPSTSSGGSSNFRSIAADDQAGVQCIYGARDTSFKPVITGVSVSGNQVTITGTNLPDVSGEVWFTNKHVTEVNGNPRVRVTGVAATNGGTRLVVAIPDSAGQGDLLVKRGPNGGNSLSNSFPFDGEGGAATLAITAVTPSVVENLVPGTAQTITISGAGFSPGTKVRIDDGPAAGSYSFVDANTLTLEWEPLPTLGAHTLTVTESGQIESTGITVVGNAAPALQAGDGDPGNVVTGAAELTLGGQPGDLHYVLVSTSGQPSTLPGKITLGMGNAFTELLEVGFFTLDPAGLASASVPLTGVTGTTLYWQSLEIVLPLVGNYPLRSSNLQTTFTP